MFPPAASSWANQLSPVDRGILRRFRVTGVALGLAFDLLRVPSVLQVVLALLGDGCGLDLVALLRDGELPLDELPLLESPQGVRLARLDLATGVGGDPAQQFGLDLGWSQ
ncbi:hypothetical protein C7M71_014985 [Peterkaempfera bronchialis]|uniref:Uncharacterized protein n=2 Tax=Peterkaempfera bronchialis TaxID=2126346 RepID=A0A345SXT7_9ACTN|nr:hypothetical protein C7M71_014985 [Peterkaempfera bronchialis]